MIRHLKPRQIILALACLMVVETALADEAPLNLNLPAASASRAVQVESPSAPTLAAPQPAASVSTAVKPAAEFEPPLLSGSNIHEFLGLSTLVLAGLTAVTNPGEGCEHNCVANAPRDTTGTHAQLAKATVVAAAATIAAGLIAHWDDFSLEDGFSDPDNLHVLLGVVGAGMMAYAVQKSMATTTGTVSHAGVAELGALGMLLAVKLTW